MAQSRTFRFFILILLLSGIFGASPILGQEVPDTAAHQEWGQWRVMNPKYPRILTRAKCDYDVKVDGKINSWWGFQVRNSNQQATDYVFQYEGGFPNGTNALTAPSMVTNVPFENIYTGGTQIWGGCKDHPLPNALKIRVLCMAPTGQDMPCFKDSSGNAIAAAKVSGSAVGPLGSQTGTTAASTARGTGGNKQTGLSGSVWKCAADYDFNNTSGQIEHYAVEWRLTFNPDGSFTNCDVADSDCFHTGGDKWNLSGNRVSWKQAGSMGDYSGTLKGDSMALDFTGIATHGTLACSREE